MQFRGAHSSSSWTSLKLGEQERNQISFRCLPSQSKMITRHAQEQESHSGEQLHGDLLKLTLTYVRFMQ